MRRALRLTSPSLTKASATTPARQLHAIPRSAPTSSAPKGTRSLATGLSPSSTPAPRSSIFAPLDTFTRRHVGPQPESVGKMLDYLGFKSMDAFIAECVPESIRISENVVSEEGEHAIRALSEQELLRRAKELGAKNKVHRSFIGMGYHQAVGYCSLQSSRPRWSSPSAHAYRRSSRRLSFETWCESFCSSLDLGSDADPTPTHSENHGWFSQQVSRFRKQREPQLTFADSQVFALPGRDRSR